MPVHHPDPGLLTEYAAGSCGEAAGVVVASHVSLCAACAATCDDLERVGGALLDAMPGASMSAGALDRMLSAIDEPREIADPGAPTPADAVFPRPLRDYLGFASHETPWKRVARGLSTFRAGEAHGAQQLRLMRIEAGASMPCHQHDGRELTLVLSGGFSDENGHFVRGDLADLGAGVSHAPVADADAECVCLALNEGGIRLSGLVGRLLTPFVRF